MNIFARNLKELREKSDISRAEMADLLGITTAAYSFYETAKRQPGLDNLCKIAAALHVTTDELLGYSLDEFAKCCEIVKPDFTIKDNTSENRVGLAVKAEPQDFCPLDMDKQDFIDLVRKCATIPQEQILEKFKMAYMQRFFKQAFKNNPDQPDKAQ